MVALWSSDSCLARDHNNEPRVHEYSLERSKRSRLDRNCSFHAINGHADRTQDFEHKDLERLDRPGTPNAINHHLINVCLYLARHAGSLLAPVQASKRGHCKV